VIAALSVLADKDPRTYGIIHSTQTVLLPSAKRAIVSLEISIRESAGVKIVDLDGKATIGVGNDLLNDKLRELVASGSLDLLLNLVNLTQVDSSSIGTIAGTFVSLSRQGGSLKLLCPRGRVQVALSVMRLLDSIPTFEDEAQALASFQPRGSSART
jgi:anti-sigma B factor antagonist